MLRVSRTADRRLVLISAVNPLHFTSAETNARDTGQIKRISSVNSRGAGSIPQNILTERSADAFDTETLSFTRKQMLLLNKSGVATQDYRAQRGFALVLLSAPVS